MYGDSFAQVQNWDFLGCNNAEMYAENFIGPAFYNGPFKTHDLARPVSILHLENVDDVLIKCTWTWARERDQVVWVSDAWQRERHRLHYKSDALVLTLCVRICADEYIYYSHPTLRQGRNARNVIPPMWLVVWLVVYSRTELTWNRNTTLSRGLGLC